MAFLIFCLRLVHQSSFTLVLFLSVVWCACRVQGSQNHSFVFCISFYFKKSKNICLSSCIAFCIFALYLHQICFGVLVRTSYRKILHSSFEEELCISCSSIPCFHGHNAFALIVRCAFYFMLRHNTISCNVISLF